MKTNNCNIPIATLLAFSLSSFNSLAADSAQFKITGKFLPTTCDISLSETEINLNDIKYGELDKQKSGDRFMGRLWTSDVGVYEKTPDTELRVNCDSQTSVGFNVVDNYSSHAPLNLLGTDIQGGDLSNAFGLKPLSGLKRNSKLGGYFFSMHSPSVNSSEGQEKEPEFLSSGIQNSRESVIKWIKKRLIGDSTLSKYWSFSNSNDPIKAKKFYVKIKPHLFFYYDSKRRDMNDEITFEGSSTFTIFYI